MQYGVICTVAQQFENAKSWDRKYSVKEDAYKGKFFVLGEPKGFKSETTLPDTVKIGRINLQVVLQKTVFESIFKTSSKTKTLIETSLMDIEVTEWTFKKELYLSLTKKFKYVKILSLSEAKQVLEYLSEQENKKETD